jgi:hypothetical protein
MELHLAVRIPQMHKVKESFDQMGAGANGSTSVKNIK